MLKEAVCFICPWQCLVLFHQLGSVQVYWEYTPGLCGRQLSCSLFFPAGCSLLVSLVCLHSPLITSSGPVLPRFFLLHARIRKQFFLLNLRLSMISLALLRNNRNVFIEKVSESVQRSKLLI